MTAPRNQYREYVESLVQSDDVDALLTYEEWLEEELKEMWEEYGSPYL